MRAGDTLSLFAHYRWLLVIGTLLGLLVGVGGVALPSTSEQPATPPTAQLIITAKSLPEVTAPEGIQWKPSDTKDVIASVVAFGLTGVDISEAMKKLGSYEYYQFVRHVDILQGDGVIRVQIAIDLTAYEAWIEDPSDSDAMTPLVKAGVGAAQAMVTLVESRVTARIPDAVHVDYTRSFGQSTKTVVAEGEPVPVPPSLLTKAIRVGAGAAGGLILGALAAVAVYLRRRTVVGSGSIEDLTDLPVTSIAQSPNSLSIALDLLKAQLLDTDEARGSVALATASPKDYELLSQGEALQQPEGIELLDASDPEGFRQARAAKALVVVALAYHTSIADLRSLLQNLAIAGVAPSGVLLVSGKALGIKN